MVRNRGLYKPYDFSRIGLPGPNGVFGLMALALREGSGGYKDDAIGVAGGIRICRLQKPDFTGPSIVGEQGERKGANIPSP